MDERWKLGKEGKSKWKVDTRVKRSGSGITTATTHGTLHNKGLPACQLFSSSVHRYCRVLVHTRVYDPPSGTAATMNRDGETAPFFTSQFCHAPAPPHGVCTALYHTGKSIATVQQSLLLSALSPYCTPATESYSIPTINRSVIPPTRVARN